MCGVSLCVIQKSPAIRRPMPQLGCCARDNYFTVITDHFLRFFYKYRFGSLFQNKEFNGLHNGDDGPGSLAGIANDYGLDGPGSNPGGDEIFRSYRPALGPTQPPVQLVPALSRG